jgi:hypothetical protein
MTNKLLTALLEFGADNPPRFSPTFLYNEGWLLRLVLDWFSTHPIPAHPLTFVEGAQWFSEAFLPSPFLKRFNGDPLAEGRTEADGVIGHFQIVRGTRRGLSLLPDATQFVALEAKLMSELSRKTTNASYFDQAARNVACIAELLRLGDRHASNMSHLGFYVLAPQSRIQKGIFTELLNQESMTDKVAQRVAAYEGVRDQWHRDWFQPMLPYIKIGLLSWEEILRTLGKFDQTAAEGLETFYQKAMHFNNPNYRP